ncbi:MAG: hypothetical protein GX606_02665 [Elusimicrobia bacterium]|nr:hypothetical protein [Elusimicrobiota bacterium]
MSRAYYYLVSSLPYLQFDQKPSLSVEGFLALCADHLAAEEMGALRAVLAGDETVSCCSVAADWFRFDKSLRNALVVVRASRLGRDSEDDIRTDGDYDAEAVEIAAQVVREEDPLAAERLLVKRLWGVVDHIGTGHMFDAGALIVYGLKLKLLERLEYFRSSSGAGIWEGIVTGEAMHKTLAGIGDQ